MLISGPSQSGKTSFVYNLLLEKEKLIEPVPTTIILYYEEYQSIYGRMLNEKLITKIIEGVPNYNVIRDTIKDIQEETPGSTLAIFDDSRESLASLQPLFTIGSHHLNCSAIVLTQMLFEEGPHLRYTHNYQLLIK